MCWSDPSISLPPLFLLSSSSQVVFVALSVCVAVLCILNYGQVEVCVSVLGNESGDSVIVFGKVCLWVLVLVFTQCVQQHHSQARRRGYLRFYRQMQGLNHLPLTIHSAGTAAHLFVVCCSCRGHFSPQGGSNA